MSVGSCGPFDKDESDTKSDYDRLAVEADALRVENRLLMRELAEMRAVIKSVTGVLNNLMKKNEIGGVPLQRSVKHSAGKKRAMTMETETIDRLVEHVTQFRPVSAHGGIKRRQDSLDDFACGFGCQVLLELRRRLDQVWSGRFSAW